MSCTIWLWAVHLWAPAAQCWCPRSVLYLWALSISQYVLASQFICEHSPCCPVVWFSWGEQCICELFQMFFSQCCHVLLYLSWGEQYICERQLLHVGLTILCDLAAYLWALSMVLHHVVMSFYILAGVSSAFVSANCSMLVSQYSVTSRRGLYLSLHTLMIRHFLFVSAKIITQNFQNFQLLLKSLFFRKNRNELQ
jgi:hypothetical protein